jgi:release factor glutamine methyltransferase
MLAATARQWLARELGERYPPGEAAAIARIVLEDAFARRPALTADDRARLEAIATRLRAGEPVQYVLGEADFFGLKFRVTPAVLIPRQETEELVAWVLEDVSAFAKATADASAVASAKADAANQPTILDAGLGSGCIGLTIRRKNPSVRLIGLEKSADALAVARDNAARLLGPDAEGVDLRAGDLLDPAAWRDLPPLDVIVSNPPYIPRGEAHLVPPHVLEHEPHLALFVPGDAEPLVFYDVIGELGRQALKPGGRLFFECNEFNARDVVARLKQQGYGEVELRKDISGADRMIKAIR